MLKKKNVFLGFLGQKSDNLNKFLVKFLSKNKSLYISYFISFQVMVKTVFSKTYQLVPISPHYVRQWTYKQYVCELRYVSELRVPPNLIWCLGGIKIQIDFPPVLLAALIRQRFLNIQRGQESVDKHSEQH